MLLLLDSHPRAMGYYLHAGWCSSHNLCDLLLSYSLVFACHMDSRIKRLFLRKMGRASELEK